MSRRRSLVTAVVLAAGLAAPLTATTGSSAAAAPARPAAKPAVQKLVEYGDKAVWVPKGRSLSLRFDGYRGDVVSLSGVFPALVRLYGAGRRVPDSWDGSGYFTLPRTGRFVLRTSASPYHARRIGLLKARLHEVVTDGPAVRTPRTRRGYVDMAVLQLEPGGRITVDDGRDDNRLYLPHRTYATLWGEHLMLRTGFDIRTSDSGLAETTARPGRALVRVRSGHRVTATSTVSVAAGDRSILLPPDDPMPRKAVREYAVTFEAAADDLVYLDTLAGPSPTDGASLLDRFGATTVQTMRRDLTVPASWVVPTTGTHEISAVTSAIGGATSSEVVLRKGIRVAALSPDGPAVDFTTDGSGTLLYSLATGVGERLESTSTGLSPDARWSVMMGRRTPWSCGPREPGGPLGCGENGFIAISQAVPAANKDAFGLSDAVAVFAPARGVTGTVSVRLLSQRAP